MDRISIGVGIAAVAANHKTEVTSSKLSELASGERLIWDYT